MSWIDNVLSAVNNFSAAKSKEQNLRESISLSKDLITLLGKREGRNIADSQTVKSAASTVLLVQLANLIYIEGNRVTNKKVIPIIISILLILLFCFGGWLVYTVIGLTLWLLIPATGIALTMCRLIQILVNKKTVMEWLVEYEKDISVASKKMKGLND